MHLPVAEPKPALRERSSPSVRWRIAREWESRLDPGDLELEAWLDRGQASIVKDGRHRTVYRLDLPHGSFYLKQYRATNIGKRLVDLIRGSASRREWDVARELVRRGIATIRPVAFGQDADLAGNYFLSEEATGAIPLSDYLREQLPALPDDARAALRGRLVDELARFVARVHEAGVCHDDLHAGNLLLSFDASGAPAFALIDLPGVRLRKRLRWSACRDNLVMLRASFDTLATPAERARFWKIYLAARPSLQFDAQAARCDIEARTQAYLRRLHRSRERRSLAENRDFHRVTRAKFRGWGVSDVSRAALAMLAEDPDAPLLAHLHQPVKLTRGAWIVEGAVPGTNPVAAVAYKRYRSRNFWKTLLDAVRGSRARRAWRAGHALLSRGISTPCPLVFCESRNRLDPASYLGTAWIADARNLHEYAWHLEGVSPASRSARLRQCAESLGALIGELHRWRYSHRDLKGCNLLLVERADAIEAFLVDLDSVRLKRVLTRGAAAKNLARLAASLRIYAWIGVRPRVRFLRAYLRSAGFAGSEAQWFWRRIARLVERDARHRQRTGKPAL